MENLRSRPSAAEHAVKEIPLQDEVSVDESAAFEEISATIESEKSGIWSKPPFRQAHFLARLFFGRKFFSHRVGGLSYLIQWTMALVWYFYDYESFKDSILIWSVPFCGLFQSLNAMATFWFLPKATREQGYFSDKKTMSYQFITENSFFAMILLFQWLYFNDFFYSLIRQTMLPELVFVFCPYIIRPFWPKTSFRDSMGFPENKTDLNRVFYSYAILVTKCFYVFAKHYIGFFLNYVRFMDRLTPAQQHNMYLLEIFSSMATTTSIFLHTLKFKKYISARTSFYIYAASYFATFYGFITSYDIFLRNVDLVLLTAVGIYLNFGPKWRQDAWQVVMIALLYSARYGYIPSIATGVEGEVGVSA